MRGFSSVLRVGRGAAELGEHAVGGLRVQEGDLFAAGLNGDVVAAMRRLETHTTLAEVESWPLREYLASGGDPRWFAGHTKSLMNRHLDRLTGLDLRGVPGRTP